MEMTALVEAVKEHAQKNYNTGGWDYVIETYEDEEIEEVIAGATTVEEAIKLMGEEIGELDDVRKDVQAEIF